MKTIKTIIITASVALPALLGAQPAVMQSDAQGYLQRGILMYQSRNYVGAIDQLGHLRHLPATADEQEQADYYLALSRFERDENTGLSGLQEFVDKYPGSLLTQDVLLRQGNYHFYHGEFGDALVAYSQVRGRSLDLDADEDLRYRMAYCDLQLGNYRDAKALYDGLAGTRRYDDATRFYNAYIAYAGGDYDDAYSRFQTVSRTGELGYQSQYYLCQIDYAKQRYQQVVTLGESLIDDDVNDYFMPEVHRLVGESYFHLGNNAQARAHLNKYVATTQDSVVRSSAYALGVMDFDARDWNSAIDRLSQVIGGDDAMGQSANLYLGQSYLKTGNQKQAAMAFERAANADHDPNVKETAFYNYAVSQSRGASTPFGGGITLFEQFLNRYPRSKYKSQVEDYLVEAYTTSGDYAKALESINRIDKPSDKVLKAKQNVLYNLGVQATQKGQNQQAANYLSQAINLGAYDRKVRNESRLWLAETQYARGQLAKAATNLQDYINNAATTDANLGKAYYNLGYVQYQQKKYAAARTSLQRAIATGKLGADLTGDAYDRIGDTYYYAQDFTRAEQSYAKAMSNNKAGADGSLYSKAMMAGLKKNYQSKVDQLDQLLTNYPHSTKVPAALLEKGRALESLGKNQQAIDTYTQLANTHGKTAEGRNGLLQLALLQKSMGNTDQAIASYKKVIKNYPTSDEARVAAEDLKGIYADRGELAAYSKFLKGVPNAPQLNVNEVDQLTFEAAEKAATAAKPSITKMQNYLRDYPNGTYAANAKYYVGRYNYEHGNLDAALTHLNQALAAAPDASFAEDALAMKSDIQARKGDKTGAIATYRQIVEKSSSDDNKTSAQLAMMRYSADLKKWNDVLDLCAQLESNSSLNADEQAEVSLNRALALAAQGKTAQAEAGLKTLAKNTETEWGARANYELASLQLQAGNTKTAERTVNAFIDSGSSQQYWVARSYILLSDIYVKQGKRADAREYLESLKQNYPGKEKDIAADIDARLKSLATSKGTSSKQRTSRSTGKSKNRNNTSSADNKRK